MIKTSHIFEKGHNNKGFEKIEKWIQDSNVCATDLMAIVCAKFSLVPQVMRNEITFDKTQIMLQGTTYEIAIRKVLYNNEKTETDISETMER